MKAAAFRLMSFCGTQEVRGERPEVQLKELMSLSHSDILLIEAHHSFISPSQCLSKGV